MLNKSSYMVLNYNTSPVCIKTRYSSEVVPAGNDKNPSGIPLSLDDIIYVNNTGNAFKIGLLRFDSEYEDELYKELRISDWKDILTNNEIYDIILNPDISRLERLLVIDNQMYFDRVYGAFLGLRNAGANISTKVDDIMRVRRKELKEHKRKSNIVLTAKAHESNENADIKMAEMQKQIAEMQKLIESMTAERDIKTDATDPVESATEFANVLPEKKTATKPRTTRTKKTTASTTKKEES